MRFAAGGVALLALAGGATGAPAAGGDSADTWDVTDPGVPREDIRFEATEGTWISVDVSPAGDLLVFDLLGDIYMRQQRLDEARREFEEVVKRNPDSVPARTMIGMILFVQQKNDESKKVYEQILTQLGMAKAPKK